MVSLFSQLHLLVQLAPIVCVFLFLINEDVRNRFMSSVDAIKSFSIRTTNAPDDSVLPQGQLSSMVEKKVCRKLKLEVSSLELTASAVVQRVLEEFSAATQ